jgi:hypothetical protein
MNDLDFLVELGNTTAAVAAQICENPRAALSHGEAYSVPLTTHAQLDTCSWPRFTGCGVFGRDEGGSGFSFTAQHIETL